MPGDNKFHFAIDRGGTFTDVFVTLPDGSSTVDKLLSVDPANYPDAPREGIRRALERHTGRPHPRAEPVPTADIGSIRMGTTVATNALLERQGERCALLTTRGFRDLLHIGNQARPAIFDLEIKTPEVLYDAVVEVDERVAMAADGELTGVTGERVRVLQPLDEPAVRAALQGLRDDGFRSVAVVLLHAYAWPAHELAVGDIARELGFEQVSLSHVVMPMVKAVPRGYTSTADAYLTPVLAAYISSFVSSDGGLTPVDRFSGHKAILSGPAGGVVGYARTAFEPGAPVIGFDMGGTSTDVSRFDGAYEHTMEAVTAGIPIQAPQLDINTVAAGGGSRLFLQQGLFVVGPESAGAHPGPVCYRKGGHLAVTDANLVLGRVVPEFFPAIFGPNEDQPLDEAAARAAFEELAAGADADETAFGFLRVANEAMCRPIRNLTQMKGFDIKTHVLSCFGGAGPQHACAIAKALGMRTIVVHRFSGILSAFGLSLADVVVERQHPAAQRLADAPTERLFDELEADARAELRRQGFADERIAVERFLNLRYQGTDTALMTLGPDFAANFVGRYSREFGFTLPDRDVLIDDVRVRATGGSDVAARAPLQWTGEPAQPPPQPLLVKSVFFEGGRADTPVYRLEQLPPGTELEGPVLIMQSVSTVVVEPDCTATVTDFGDIRIAVHPDQHHTPITTALDNVQLSIFAHRFMGIAEQMGRTLQRTSISVNIKERLDFSCALFGPDGSLVANAPHLPVHLGAMQEAVRFQVKYWGDDLREGDVLVSNHPQLASGSHCPDISVFTPVFSRAGDIVFFVACRGHHQDVGGIAPGSMPPLSKTLEDEGAAIVAFKLVEGGVFQEQGITDLLLAPGAIPGNSGTRNLADNLSDLRAQVAANQRGVQLMGELIDEYSLDVVQAYMHHIQANAEQAVRAMLRRFPRDVAEAEDFLDDGSPIKLRIAIDREAGSAVFDFSGTGPEIYGNLNAPPAVTYSAIIYCLRCLLTGSDIPLNQGCLEPITVVIPEGSLLNPSAGAAVVGGNVLTSQRVTDVILRAFGACAASQGCMNNLTFGDDSMGYYETIAGGAGAGPHWHGRSGVHTHMTNTRITDPEILERRFPVLLREFGLRAGSGGAGRFRGGDGVRREIEFLRPLTVSILSERRAFAPYGMEGGGDAQRGRNTLTFAADGRTVSLGGKATVQVAAGDRLLVESPGGGGWGSSGSPAGSAAASGSPAGSAAASVPVRTSGSVQQYTRDQESA